MALSADAQVVFELGDYNDLPVAASVKIYRGAAVGDNGSGYARGLVAGDPFLGFAEAQADNSGSGRADLGAGNGVAGNITCRVLQQGRIKLSVTGVTGVGDLRKQVYASADGTFTLTASTNTPVGRVVRYETGTTVIVEFDATNGIGLVASLTENAGAIGGTNDGNLPDLSAADATLAAAIREVATKLNELITRLK